ncbi:hypothetical protein HKD37_12G034756 [Glycine soja]
MDVDAQPTMDETILVGDDLMTGPPSPVVPPEIASHVLQGLQINDIEPFCQDEIALYKQCAERRDKEIRKRLQDSEFKLGSSMPLDEAKGRASQLEAEVTSLERLQLRIRLPLDQADFWTAGSTRMILQIVRWSPISKDVTLFIEYHVTLGCVNVMRLILASGVEGIEGFRQRWSLHGRLTDSKNRLQFLKQGLESRKKG